MRRKLRPFTVQGLVLYRKIKTYNLSSMVDDYEICKRLGYDSYREFMIATGNRADISEGMARRRVKSYIIKLSDMMFDDMMKGDVLHINGFGYIALSRVRDFWREHTVTHMNIKYGMVYKLLKSVKKYTYRRYYIFMTRFGMDKFKKYLEDGHTVGYALRDE